MNGEPRRRLARCATTATGAMRRCGAYSNVAFYVDIEAMTNAVTVARADGQFAIVPRANTGATHARARAMAFASFAPSAGAMGVKSMRKGNNCA